MRLFLISALFILSASPLAAQAATVDFFGPIVPDACKCESVVVEGGEAGETSVGAPGYGCVLQVLQNLIRLAISLGIAFATLALMYAGFVWMTSGPNPGRREQGRTLLINVFVGLFVMLSAWLIVDFVMKALYRENSGFGPWNSILAGTGSDQCLVARKEAGIIDGAIGIVTGPAVGSGGAGGSGSVTSPSLTHAAAAAKLKAAGISIVSTGNCSDQTNSNCTSLNGMAENTVNQAIAIKQACKCTVTVTGGTEVGHADGSLSHGAGFKIDLRPTAQLDAFIKGLTPSGTRGSDSIYKDRCGNEYVREGDHWDITVSKGVCSPPK